MQSCNVVFRMLHQSGIGTKKTSAKVVADEDEEKPVESWCIEYYYAYWASMSSLLLHWKGLLSKR